MLPNPYNPSGAQWSDNKVIQGRVSQEDFAFLKSKFPFNTGMVDKLVAISFKKIIDELRKIDSEIQFATALYVDDPSYTILDDVITRLQVVERRATNGSVGSGRQAATQHDAGGVGSIRSEMQRDEVVRPDPKGRIKTRKRSAKSTKEKGEQRG